MQAEQQMHDFVVAFIDGLWSLPFVVPIMTLMVIGAVLSWVVGMTGGGAVEADEE